MIVLNTQAQDAIKKGVDTICSAVKVTLGPKGRHVGIKINNNQPHLTKDGVTVALSVNLHDPFENFAAQVVKDASIKTAAEAGDGTTTAIILAQSIVNSGLKNMASGANPMDLKRGIDKAVKKVIDEIKTIARPVQESEIKHVATISANNDTDMGGLIGEAISKIGVDGVIIVGQSDTGQNQIEYMSGMDVPQGYASPFFVNDPAKGQVVFENPYVLIIDDVFSNVNEFTALADKYVSDYQKTRRPLIVIAENFMNDTLHVLIQNKVKAGLPIAAIRSHGFGQNKRLLNEDIAVFTGASIVGESYALTLEQADLSHLGSADKIIISADSTTIIKGHGKKQTIEERINELKVQIQNSKDNAYTQHRLAKLSGKVAILKLGASSDVELKEKRDRADDAIQATQAAVKEGIVPGGGVCYIRCISALNDLKGNNDDENTGIKIIRSALEAPLSQIVQNAGVGHETVLTAVKEGKDDYGYDAHGEKYCFMIEEGIIDPAKVSRVALQNAASVASMLLTTECIVVEGSR